MMTASKRPLVVVIPSFHYSAGALVTAERHEGGLRHGATPRTSGPLFVGHARGDRRESAIDVGYFAGDGAGEVGKQKRGHVTDLVEGHIAPQGGGLLDKMQNLGKAGDTGGGTRLEWACA